MFTLSSALVFPQAGWFNETFATNSADMVSLVEVPLHVDIQTIEPNKVFRTKSALVVSDILMHVLVVFPHSKKP